MKVMLALVLAVTAVNAVAQNQSYDATGAVKNQYKEFLSVVNKSASPITVGMAVCADTTADDGVAVSVCLGEGFKPIGIVTQASCAVNARCLLQTKGYFALGKFDYLATATVAGGMIYADVDGDLVRPATVLVSHFPIGTTFDAVAADSSALEIYIDL